MIAADTNVLVRLLVRDDEEQYQRALEWFSRDSVWISRTVLLETEWVLRSAYDCSRLEVLHMFEALLNLEGVVVESSEMVKRAVEAYRDGMDFADGLHLFAAHQVACSFLTFDRDLVKRAGGQGVSAATC